LKPGGASFTLGGMEIFRAPWGKSLRWTSALSSLLLIGIALIPWKAPHGAKMPPWFPTYLFTMERVMPLAVLLGAGCFTIRGYRITEDAIEVQRLFWITRLPRPTLVSATLEPGVAKGSLRTCGNGGLFSFSGWYWNRPLGSYRMLATDLNRLVVLRFSDRKPMLISPDQPEAFVKALGF